MRLKAAQWEQIKSLFESALAHTPETRAQFLELTCGQPEIKKRVLRLLAYQREMGSFLSRDVFTPDAHQSLVSDPKPTFADGQIVAKRFRIKQYLARGGMGEVYEALDCELDSPVAVKSIRADLLNDRMLQQLRAEVQLAKQVTHPNICRVYDLFRHDSEGSPSTLLISMELLKGETLAKRLQHGERLTTTEVLPIVSQIANALDAAHRASIIHRDLKPENVMLVPVDGGSRAVVMDFGVALSMDLLSGSATPMLAGTPAYMSPEQLNGGELTPASDIYSLGLLMYRMLTGQHAFQAPLLTFESVAKFPQSIRPPSKLVASLNRRWETAIVTCLRREPAQRYRSALLVVDTLNGSDRRFINRYRTTFYAFAVASCLVIAVSLTNRTAATPLRISEYSQLTHNGHTGYVVGTDGSQLYLTRLNPFLIDEVAVSGGEIETVRSITLPNPFLFNVSPDGSTFLVQSWAARPSSPLYTVQILGGAHRYLADATVASGTWSPDGKLVAYTTSRGDLNVVNSDATGAHKLALVGAAAYPLSWSPDGSTIRFSRDLESIWEITSSGSNLHQLLAGWHKSQHKCCGTWSPDGKFFVFLAGPLGPAEFPEAQIYTLDERRGLFQRQVKDPVQLTSGPVDWSPPVFMKDGKKMFATGTTKRGELVRIDMKSGQFEPFLGGASADSISFSKDGRFVAYITYPDGSLWRANRDGSARVQLTSSLLRPRSISWSPDGNQLVFDAISPQGPHLWIVPSTGGSPHRLLPEDSGPEREPNWSPDGRTILFATGSLESNESHIRTLDLGTHQTSTLPGSDGKIAPRWSSDGRFINAASLDTSTIYVFDSKTQQWSALKTGPHACARWSSDSRSIYFMRYATDPAILRIPVTGGEAKVVVSLKNFPVTGTYGLWFGLDPTDAPLMLRDASTTDVYALTLEEK